MTKRAGEFFRTVRDIGIDAAIISDMALMDICTSRAPGLPIHLSTQSLATNYETLNFWKDEGLERVVLAREEVSMDEIKEMHKKKIGCREIELFIHGANVFLIQGRYRIIKPWCIVIRTVVDIAQSCRWKYGLFDMPFTGEKEYGRCWRRSGIEEILDECR